ncbi:MAG: TolC family protein [bacterium]
MIQKNSIYYFCFIGSVFFLLLGSSFFFSQDLKAEDDSSLNLQQCVQLSFEKNLDLKLDIIDFEQAQDYYEKTKIVGDEELIEQAEDKLKQTEEKLYKSKAGLAVDVEREYYNWFQARGNLQAEKDALEEQKQQLQEDKIKYENGFISIMDLQKSEKNLEDRKNAYASGRESFKTRNMRFNKLLGRDLDQEIILVKEKFFEPAILTLEESIEIARKNRTDIKSARGKLVDAKNNFEKIDNIYSSDIEIEKAETDVRRAELELEKTKQSLLINVRDNYFSFIDAYRVIDDAEYDLKLAISEKEEQLLRYEEGDISTSRMLEARKNVMNKEKEVIRAEWDYNLARTDYLQTLGVWELDAYLEEISSFEMIEELKEKQWTGDENG